MQSLSEPTIWISIKESHTTTAHKIYSVKTLGHFNVTLQFVSFVNLKIQILHQQQLIQTFLKITSLDKVASDVAISYPLNMKTSTQRIRYLGSTGLQEKAHFRSKDRIILRVVDEKVFDNDYLPCRGQKINSWAPCCLPMLCKNVVQCTQSITWTDGSFIIVRLQSRKSTSTPIS